MDESDKATEAFRRKMGRFLENPEKPIILPEIAQPKAPKIPDHNRQVGGSVAGAGSGDFHVYRNLRRKEAARQGFIMREARKEEQAAEFAAAMSAAKELDDERTSKKRLKRLQQKQKTLAKKEKKGDDKAKTTDGASTSTASQDDASDDSE